jgi:hypothetical protein
MTMDISTCCQWRVTGRQPWNPASAKTGQIWGTRHSLRIEISLPDHRFPRGVCEKCGLTPPRINFDLGGSHAGTREATAKCTYCRYIAGETNLFHGFVCKAILQDHIKKEVEVRSMAGSVVL